METITKTKGKRSKKLATAVTAIGIGAALLVSGSSFAIWQDGQSIGQQPITIQTGELGFEDSRATGSWTLNGVEVPTAELGSVKLVPGDKIEYNGSQAVRVVGDNLTGWLYFQGLSTVQGALAESPAASLRWSVDGIQEAKQLTAADHLADQPVSFSVTMAPMGSSVYGDGSLAHGLSLDLSSVRVAVSSLKPEAEEDLTAPWIIEDQAVRTAVLDHLGLTEADQLTVRMKKLVTGLEFWDAPAGTDFSQLAEMPYISWLSITGENLGDTELATLPQLPSLNSFSLSGAQDVTTLSFLKGENERLTSLNIMSLPSLTSLDAVSEMKALENLEFMSVPISALPALNSLARLDFVRGYDLPALMDITGLEGADSITSLHLSEVPSLTTLGPIPTLTGLQNLSVTGAPSITDFSGLTALTDLQSLSLVGMSGMSDFSSLTPLTSLTLLELSDTVFSDLSLIAGMSELETLAIKGTAVTDLGPLASLLKLSTLHASGLSIEDWAPVAHVTNIY